MVWVESRSAIVGDSREPVFWHPLPKLLPVKISGQNHISMTNGSYLSVRSVLDYGTELNSFFCDNYIDTRRKQQGDIEQAREYLTKALQTFKRLGTLIEPEKVRKELAELPSTA